MENKKRRKCRKEGYKLLVRRARVGEKKGVVGGQKTSSCSLVRSVFLWLKQKLTEEKL